MARTPAQTQRTICKLWTRNMYETTLNFERTKQENQEPRITLLTCIQNLLTSSTPCRLTRAISSSSLICSSPASREAQEALVSAGRQAGHHGCICTSGEAGEEEGDWELRFSRPGVMRGLHSPCVGSPIGLPNKSKSLQPISSCILVCERCFHVVPRKG